MPGVWAAPLSAPFHVGTMLLLTDGSVLAQNSGTRLWWRLRPDRAGRYDQGGWRATAESTNAPLYFASAVMGDGSVFVAGGEYSNNAHTAADLCTAERYDPVAEAWSALPTPNGWTAIGDAPCCVLPDGRLLLGNIQAGACALWDPAAKSWTATGPKLNASSSEETWTLLPDGGVLTVDCVGSPASEKFVGDAWTANGATPVELVEAASLEIGPAILLPDGTVFALGATGRTARYAPGADSGQPGTWTAGPDIPPDAGQALGAKDAPACLLPNGRVLCAVGPVDGARDTYDGPTRFLEFDPAGPGAWQALPPPGEGVLAPFVHRFLLLPNGQVLVSNGTPVVQVFQPDGEAPAEWAPTILACPTEIQAGDTIQLQGAQLNGLSQACSYGDDAAMATNYPLVRLRGPYPSEAVTFARTHDHSTMGVSTGPSLHHTFFDVPADAASGIYALSVIANGLGSAERPVNLTASGAAARRPAPPGATGAKQTFGEEELFLRDLSEVHMLIDFVSGRSDKSLAGLNGAESHDAAGKPMNPMTAQEIVEEICKISYPPTGGLEANAEQAAFMLVVKDRLNYLAAPARGLTVAFTSMFSGVALDLHPLPAWRFWAKRKKAAAAAALTALGPTPPGTPDRPPLAPLGQRKEHFYSAQTAFPNLERPARRFRRFYDGLPAATIVLILFIAYINWDISVISGILQQISAAQGSYTSLFDSKQSFLPTSAACSPGPTPTKAAPAPTKTAPAPAPPTRARRPGAKAAAKPAAAPAAPPALTDAQRISCAEAEAALMRLAAARANLQTVMRPGIHLHPVALSMELMELTLDGPPQHAGSRPTASNPLQPSRLEDFTIDVLGAFNTIIIPTAFGLLGTLAGLMRTITLKMRESILAPRDVIISKIGIGLGMSAGLAVGLFMNGARSPGSTITLTAAGLSFLAGFGAEAFFTFLDLAISRLFTVGQAPAPISTPAARQLSVSPPK